MQNQNVSVKFNGQDITGYDLTDSYNGSTFFTKAKRGLAKAWQDLVDSKIIEGGATFYQVIHFLDDRKMKVHIYCAVD